MCEAKELSLSFLNVGIYFEILKFKFRFLSNIKHLDRKKAPISEKESKFKVNRKKYRFFDSLFLVTMHENG